MKNSLHLPSLQKKIIKLNNINLEDTGEYELKYQIIENKESLVDPEKISYEVKYILSFPRESIERPLSYRIPAFAGMTAKRKS